MNDENTHSKLISRYNTINVQTTFERIVKKFNKNNSAIGITQDMF